jgi:hypothetical protein
MPRAFLQRYNEPRMKRLSRGAVPPAFETQDADGQNPGSNDVLGRGRILIVFSAHPEWLRCARSREGKLRDYELQVLASTPEPAGETASDMVRVGHANAATHRAYGVAEDEAVAFLVGKDGSVKEIYEGEPDLDAIFALIETMPMRRAEVARRTT